MVHHFKNICSSANQGFFYLGLLVFSLSLMSCTSQLTVNTAAAIDCKKNPEVEICNSSRFKIIAAQEGIDHIEVTWEKLKDASEYSLVVGTDITCSTSIIELPGIIETSSKIKITQPGVFYICIFANIRGERVAANNNGYPIRIRNKNAEVEPAPPVAVNMTPSAFNEDTTSTIILTFTDPNDDLATNCTVSNLTNITVINTCACDAYGICSVSVQGTANYFGNASFSFTVTAGGDVSNTATAYLTITAVDDPPSAINITPNAFFQDSISAITLSYTDFDNVATSCAVSNLSNISITTACACDSGGVCTVSVQGTAAYSGIASFDYTITSGGVTTAAASASLSIVAVGSPIANDFSPAAFNEDTISVITLDYTDTENDLATSCSTSALSNITVTTGCTCTVGGVCTVSVRGTTNFYGAGSFNFTVTAGGQVSNSATASLSITSIDDQPVASNLTPPSFDEDVISTIILSYTDADNDLATACTISALTNVTVTTSCSCSSGVCSVNVKGTANYHGTASFSYTVTANGQTSNSATATLTIDAIEDAPIANAGPDQNVDEFDTVTLDGSASSDAEGAGVTYLWSQTAGTTVTLSSTTVAQPTFTLGNLTASTTLTFQLIVNDGALSSTPDTVNIIVTAVNETPVAVADEGISAQDSSVTISVLTNDTDADSSAGSLVIDSVTQGAYGSVVDNPDHTITYTPTSGYSGVDTFTYKVSDGNSASSSATVTVYVYPTPTAFTWTGAVNSNWNNAGNWHGNAVPGINDIALFSARCGFTCPVTINASIANLKGANLHSTFRGVITQASGMTMNVGASGWVQNAGTFVGGDSAIAIGTAGLSVTGGSFTSTSSTLTINGGTSNATVFTVTDATYLHNSGTLIFIGGGCCSSSTHTINLSQNLNLHNLHSNFSSGIKLSATGGEINIANTLTHTKGLLIGTFNLYGDLIVGTNSNPSLSATINLLGTNNQTYSCASGFTGSIVINKPISGTVTPAAGTTELGLHKFTLAAGSFTAPSGSMTLSFNTGNTLFTVAAGTTFIHNSGTLVLLSSHYNPTPPTYFSLGQPLDLHNLTIDAGSINVITVSAGEILNVNGNMIHSGGQIAGTYNLYGNLTVSGGYHSNTGHIRFVNSIDQTYAWTSGTTGQLIIDKSAGQVTSAIGNTEMDCYGLALMQGTFIAPTGTLSIRWTGSREVFNIASGTTFVHNSGTLAFVGGDYNDSTPTFSLEQTVDLNHVTVNAGGGTRLTIPAGQVANVLGNFTQTSGKISGPWYFYGDVTEPAAISGLNPPLMNFVGDNAQVWTRTTATVGSTGNYIINKSMGQVTLGSNVTLNQSGQDLTITSGILNLNGKTLSVNDYLTIDAAGTLTVNGGSYTPNSGVKFVNNGTLN